MMRGTGRWRNWVRFFQLLFSINCWQFFPPSQENERDVHLCPGDRLRNFSVSSAYKILQGSLDDFCSSLWKVIWKLQVTERVRFFVWKIKHGRLTTNEWKFIRGLGDPYCQHCNCSVESIHHILRDCPLASVVWFHLVEESFMSRFFSEDLEHWISFKLGGDIGHGSDCDWGFIWASMCHLLWIWRNKNVHEPNFSRPFKAWDMVEQSVRNYSWKVPDSGWVCLNSDGASRNEEGIAGCGGLIRNSEGK